MEERIISRPPIGEEELREAIKTLGEYKAGKANLEARIIEDDRWWRLRHMETMNRREFGEEYPSAWLFNSIMGKHAAAMEAFPEPNILPREQGDEEEARALTAIVPLILTENDYEETYSLCQWKKMQSGTSIYAVYWDQSKHNGLGDISIRYVEPLNLFWEPGITDLQASRNVFHVELVSADILREQYPEARINESGDSVSVSEYVYEDNVDNTGKRLVIDWYYKKQRGNITELHYCKFVDGTLLYSSENEGQPWYNDGMYPFVFDRLFPMQGSPAGFGFIDTGKHAQEQIDKINQALITNALMNCRPRYFSLTDGSINENEFADWRKQIVHVEGSMSDISMRPIEQTGLDSVYINVSSQKIQELKETTSNQDVQTGSTGGGVTAASAIMALQETAGMPSKDATRGNYRAFEEIVHTVIERIRQFYDLPRTFRIMGNGGGYDFRRYDNSGLIARDEGSGLRKPEFDVEVRAQSETQYTKLTNNSTILDLLQRGLFNPDNADVSMMVLDMMDIPKKDKLMRNLQEYRTMKDKMQQYAQMALALAQKYEPAMAQGLMQAMQTDMVTMQPTGGGAAASNSSAMDPLGMTAREEQVRAKARASTQPE